MKTPLNIVVLGHIDSGKSTFIGRLLSEIGLIPQQTLHKNLQESKKIGKESFHLAWNTDETAQERERGITMDISHRQFETKKYLVEIIDCPGHKDYISSTISGITQADVAILVTDTPETLKDGSELHGQTFEHVQIARCLGITQFIILINKMDLVDYREDIYDQACSLLTKNLKKLKIKDHIFHFIPISAFSGWNIVKNEGNKQTNWYKGPSFVDSVDSLACPERDLNSPLRLSISGSFEVKHRTFTLFSRVESGVLKLPASLQVFPLNQQIEIINVDGLEEGEFGAGSQLCLLVNTASDDDIEVGSIACPINCPPFITETFTGSIILFETPQPLLIGSQLTLHYLQISQTVKIIKIISLKDKTGAEKRNPRLIMSNARADVIFRSSEPLVVDLFEKTKSMGRFLLRFKGSTVGTGKIIRVP